MVGGGGTRGSLAPLAAVGGNLARSAGPVLTCAAAAAASMWLAKCNRARKVEAAALERRRAELAAYNAALQATEQDLEKAWQVLEEEDRRRHAVKAVVDNIFTEIRVREAHELITAAQAQAAAVHQEAEAACSRAVRVEASSRRRSAKLGAREAALRTGEARMRRRKKALEEAEEAQERAAVELAVERAQVEHRAARAEAACAEAAGRLRATIVEVAEARDELQ
ncbi:hypothetical protein MNEG_3511, partial [Monoraphidium neglectum]